MVKSLELLASKGGIRFFGFYFFFFFFFFCFVFNFDIRRH
jgi:hypothetical protein